MRKIVFSLAFVIAAFFPIMSSLGSYHGIWNIEHGSGSTNEGAESNEQTALGADFLGSTSGVQKNDGYYRSDLRIDLPEKFELIARQVLNVLPKAQTYSLKKIVAAYGDKKRGLASFRSIYIGIDRINTDREFRRVFIHELGHIVDLGGLKSRFNEDSSKFQDGSNIIWETDPSLEFYRICWTDELTQNDQCDYADFVSEYSQVDVFEDFAESYLLFVENNASFIGMAKESPVLQSKYDFFAEIVFDGNFEITESLDSPIRQRVWDLTVQ